MDMGTFNLFLKLVADEYKLTESQILKLSRRLLADEQEFSRTWTLFKDRIVNNGVDSFRPFLSDLLNH